MARGGITSRNCRSFCVSAVFGHFSLRKARAGDGVRAFPQARRSAVCGKRRRSGAPGDGSRTSRAGAGGRNRVVVVVGWGGGRSIAWRIHTILNSLHAAYSAPGHISLVFHALFRMISSETSIYKLPAPIVSFATQLVCRTFRPRPNLPTYRNKNHRLVT